MLKPKKAEITNEGSRDQAGKESVLERQKSIKRELRKKGKRG